MGVLNSEPITTSLRLDPLDPRWQLVQRVAASQFFAKGPKLRAFLLYICENSLLGRNEDLSTQLIGTRVFGRDADYIPSEDIIVRVEARELRKRLAAFFAAEGSDEALIIEIPKGSYAPVFRPRDVPARLKPDAGAVESSEKDAVPKAGKRWTVPLLATALGVSLAIIVWQTFDSPFRKEQTVFLAGLHEPFSRSSDFSIYNDLLGALGANPRRDALLVLSNPRIITYFVSNANADPAGSSGASIPVPNELKSILNPILNEKDRDRPYLFLNATREGYTGIGEAIAAFHLGRLMNVLGRRVQLTQGRFLNWDHIAKQDLILLGGPHSNDWSYESDAQSNFSIVSNSIVNAKPLRGEQAIYTASQSADYALIQKLTTPYQFEVLLIAGISNAGTAAAGEFVADPEKMKTVYTQLRHTAAGRTFPKNWEILLKVAVHDGLPLDSSVVALRAGAASASK